MQLRIESRGQDKGRGDWRDGGITYAEVESTASRNRRYEPDIKIDTPFGKRYSWKPKSKYWKVARVRLVSIHWACSFQPSSDLAVLIVEKGSLNLKC